MGEFSHPCCLFTCRTVTNEVLRALSLVPTSRPTPWLSLHPYFLYQILATWLKFGQYGREITRSQPAGQDSAVLDYLL